MPVIVKLPSGNWRAEVRRKGKYISNTFRRRADADTSALETERTIDRGFVSKAIVVSSVHFFQYAHSLQRPTHCENASKWLLQNLCQTCCGYSDCRQNLGIRTR
jgi:hypothetical protein